MESNLKLNTKHRYTFSNSAVLNRPNGGFTQIVFRKVVGLLLHEFIRSSSFSLFSRIFLYILRK